MATATTSPVLDQLVERLSQCLTAESAKRLLKLKASRRLATRVAQLAEKCSTGELTPKERSEYENYVSFSTFVALLKSKVRRQLGQTAEK
jgi:hypothetical protein